MRFTRHPRYEAFQWTDRKKAAHLKRDARAQARIERDYPLFVGEFKPAPSLSVEDEGVYRENRAKQSDQSMRDLDAKHWRAARRAYFACSEEVRAAIRAAWSAWTGPLNAGNFSYVVRKHNGELEQLARQMRQRDAALLERIYAQFSAQADLLQPVELIADSPKCAGVTRPLPAQNISGESK